MNFNFTGQPEYQLNTSLAEELINLYGVLTKFLLTEKINRDDVVFGDYSHMKSDNSKIYDIYMLPETTEDWDNETNFSQFGLVNFETINLFVAKSSFDPIPDIVDDEGFDPVGCLVILPNNKIMEITDQSITVPGVNNLFTHNDAKSVYKLTCKPYDVSLINELDNVDISVDPVTPYETLDTYFQELIDERTEQDVEAEVTPSVVTVNKTGGLSDEKVVRPIVDKTEDDVFGEF